MRCSLENSVARTLSAGHVSLESRTGADEALGNVKVCGVHLEIVVCICDCTLEELDKDALVKILTTPKNAIVKQYKELFSLDDVELEFEDGALEAIAEKTLEKKTGARGLRSIIERVLLPAMYDVPSDPTVERVCITASTVNEGAVPIIERNPNSKRARLSPPPKVTTPKASAK